MKTIQIDRRTRMLLVLPLLFIPMLALVAYSLGLGNGPSTKASIVSGGINTVLPEARLPKTKAMDKLAIYDMAQIDSMRMQDRLKMQVLASGASNPFGAPATANTFTSLRLGSSRSNQSGTETDTNLIKVNHQMEALRRTLSQVNDQRNPITNYPSSVNGTASQTFRRRASNTQYPPSLKFTASPAPDQRPLPSSPAFSQRTPITEYPPGASADRTPSSANIDRLEALFRRMSTRSTEPDPDLADLKQLLEKLTDLQHPTKQADSPSRPASLTLPVTAASPAETHIASSLDTIPTIHNHDSLKPKDSIATPPLITAIIPETQSLVSGSIIRLELMTDATVGARRIPAGVNVFGICQTGRGRLQVVINSIKYADRVDLVSLQVYDQDGLPGISIPESLGADLIREGGAQGISNISGSFYGSSLIGSNLESALAGQATSTGLQLARNLASRKVRESRVSIPEGYKVVLKDISQKR